VERAHRLPNLQHGGARSWNRGGVPSVTETALKRAETEVVVTRAPVFVPWLAGVLVSTLAPCLAAELPPTLRLTRQEALSMAQANNPGLEVARQQVQQARARVSEASALPDPTFEATLEQESGFLRPRSAASKDLGLGLTLPFPTKLKLGADVARSAMRTSELAVRQLRQQIAAQTFQACDALLVALRHRDDLSQGKALAEDFLAKTEARLRAGTVARIDVVKAKVDLAQAVNDLIANERALAASRAALNRLLGRAPGAPVEVLDPLEVPPPLPDLETLLATAAGARPEAQMAAEQRRGARAATRLARQYWFPDLAITLSRNYTSGDPAAYSTAFSATLPLFFWQHQKGLVAESAHHELELSASQRDTLAQVELDVRTAYAAADTALRQALYLRDQLLPEAQQAYRIAATTYGLGGSSALDLLDAKRTFLAAQSQYTDALGAANDARAELERAVGQELPPATGGTHAP
jgi:cobalt-zinc-cadmium efflux system outer membrane protein